MARGHGQQMTDRHPFHAFGDGISRIFREKIDNAIIEGKSFFADGNADGGRGKTFRERKQLVPIGGTAQIPIAFGNDFSMAQDHDAVRVAQGHEGIEKTVERRRTDTGFLRRTTVKQLHDEIGQWGWRAATGGDRETRRPVARQKG